MFNTIYIDPNPFSFTFHNVTLVVRRLAKQRKKKLNKTNRIHQPFVCYSISKWEKHHHLNLFVYNTFLKLNEQKQEQKRTTKESFSFFVHVPFQVR